MMRMFAPLTKVDEAKRLVWGRLAHETPDRSGEIFDYESSKPYFKSWSDEFAKATAGTGQEPSLGNLRAMHGRVAAGKFVQLDFNDAEKAVDVCAKVVDDQEWAKVLAGVYTGFSIGGDYVGEKRAEKVNGKTFMRYTGKPTEGSLVDNPCIPTATFFQIQKMDGSMHKMAFAAVTKTEAEKTAEHNARVERTARMLARKAFWKLAPAQRIEVPEDVFSKMSEAEQKRELAKRAPDEAWQAHVTEAIRLLKQDDYEDEEDLEKPDEIDQEEWDDMTYEEKLEAIDEYGKAAAARMKKVEDEKDLVKPDDVKQEDWDEMTGVEKRQRIEEAAARAGKAARAAALAKAEEEELRKEEEEEAAKKKDAKAADTKADDEDAEKTDDEEEAAEKAAKAAGATEEDLSAVEELAQMLDKGTVTPEQLLQLAKREFSQEQRDEAAKEGDAMPDGSFPIKTVADLENAVQAFGRAKDKAAVKKHIISRAKALGATDKLPADWEGSTKEEKSAAGGMRKNLYNVAQFAGVLQACANICYGAQSDADLEGDNSPIPAQLRDWIAKGASIFQDMATEESEELIEELEDKGSAEKMAVAALSALHQRAGLRKQLADPDIKLVDFRKLAIAAVGEQEWKEGGYFQKYVEDQASCIEAILAKAGARHSKEDLNHLQSAHDHLCAMGAQCSTGEEMEGKSTGNGALLKAVLDSKITKLHETIEAMGAELAELKNTPMKPKGVLRDTSRMRVIPKGGDDSRIDPPSQPAEKKLAASVPGQHNPEAAIAMVKEQVTASAAFRKF